MKKKNNFVDVCAGIAMCSNPVFKSLEVMHDQDL